ncbi:hypothetical protein HPB50_018812 [Hyalomma asiaticum]|uniref:Uncharacterized protein n=1 Tax=Hyalomma asiaticum TaxID=266040 RepID=A0ACB7TPX2_HYAAI|nr:hypothetical protein HPB50_018812 [Hyalomma asiaticum]
MNFRWRSLVLGRETWRRGPAHGLCIRERHCYRQHQLRIGERGSDRLHCLWIGKIRGCLRLVVRRGYNLSNLFGKEIANCIFRLILLFIAHLCDNALYSVLRKGYCVSNAQAAKILGNKKGKLVCKDTAQALWSSSVLATRSVSGNVTPKKRALGELPKQQLTPEKVNVVAGLKRNKGLAALYMGAASGLIPTSFQKQRLPPPIIAST